MFAAFGLETPRSESLGQVAGLPLGRVEAATGCCWRRGSAHRRWAGGDFGTDVLSFYDILSNLNTFQIHFRYILIVVFLDGLCVLLCFILIGCWTSEANLL